MAAFCQIDDCDRATRNYAKWCDMHKARIARRGDPHYVAS